ncbi:MAG: aquaporin [Cytophagales bacterium]
MKSLPFQWKLYLIEAFSLGMFMVSASVFTILLEHPDLPFRTLIPSSDIRRAIIGFFMGLTAVLLIQSKWGQMSGAHMNPAVTLANLYLKRISAKDAFYYILAQFIGSILFVYLVKILLFDYLSHASISYIVTVPDKNGELVAFVLEFLMSFILLLSVLLLSQSKYAKYTPYFVGVLLTVYITFEAPFTGMSINPARTVGSAISGGIWNSIWLYFLAPIAGMFCAAFIFSKFYLQEIKKS